MNSVLRAALAAALLLPSIGASAQAQRFVFGSGTADASATLVAPAMAYSAERGYGFEPGSAPDSGRPYYFSVALAEGNYRVRIQFGSDSHTARTTVKAELRRLMLQDVASAAGETVERSFTVNVRTAAITAVAGIAAGAVKLKAPRETEQETWAWDRRLTLEINGENAAVRAIEITPVNTPTLFLLGDSTVCDQPGEPYASWGQMLPRFFGDGVAVANHGESGETYRDSLARRRLDKILSVMQPGDTLLMQFGHNDQKQIKEGKGFPFSTYKDEIRKHVAGVRARGGIPVIVSSMERRKFDAQNKVVPSLLDYAEASRQVAQELGVHYIDLNTLSKQFYEALGPDRSRLAFAEPTPGNIDNTHHNAYGSYELARTIATRLRALKLPVAAFLRADMADFDPAHPDAPEAFHIAPSPTVKAERPLGDPPSR